MNQPNPRPDAILLLTSTCPNCPKVLEELTQLVKQGVIGRLDVINLDQHPEMAETYGIRSVPWFRIGELDFYGIHPLAELITWSNTALTDAGVREYITQQLKDGHLSLIEAKLREHSRWLSIALELISDMDAPMQARIGVGALFESLQGSPLLHNALGKLTELTCHSDHRVRGDACYYLGLTQSPEARAVLSTCLQDSNSDVREIAQEALATLPAYS